MPSTTVTARLIAIAAFVTAVSLTAGVERLAPAAAPDEARLWLQSPAVARRLALSFDDLVADTYWVRAVVHYGSVRLGPEHERRYPLLYPLLDFATSLDPRFATAYSLGAIFLSEGYPGGPGRPDLALRLLEKGRSLSPERWQHEHDIAFVYYWWLKDFTAAAIHFERASQLPNAPAWLRTMAAQTLTKGGDRASARQLWTTLLNGSDVDWIKRSAAYRLQQLRALDDLDALLQSVTAFSTETHRPPASWDELVRAARLRGIPVDPTGVPYELDAGRPRLSPRSTLQPLPGIEAAR